ncbi:MAG: RNA pseudouridine synthase [Treponema sp.]|nr:RNA pseudouridine synthase [Treponema sp.]
MYTIENERILYQSGACLAVNKLPGEASQGAGAGMIDLPAVLARQFGLDARREGRPGTVRQPEMPQAVQRVDVPVSGCCLFACTRESLSCLNAAFARGDCDKTYWAVTEMPPPSAGIPEEGALVHWIQRGRGNKSIACDEEGPERKKAVLRYRILGEGRRYLFMEIKLLTGRGHQIRAQLARLGLHIKGDIKYGARRSEKGGGIRLHAASLAFPDPQRPGERVLVSALPHRMDPLWAALVSLAGAKS